MAGVPQHAPFDDLSRAVQAYSYSRLHGGTLAEAEQAAQRACPGCDIPSVAQASAGARQAAQAFGRIDPNDPAGAGGNVGRAYGLGAGRATPEGATHRVITATVGIQTDAGGERWTTFQVDVPLGANAEAVQAMLIETAAAVAAGEETDYPGVAFAIDVQTVIGQ